jgi:heterodisulfide reductase subunit A
MGAVKRLEDGVGEIKRMYIKPELQGRGLGKEMMARLEEKAKELVKMAVAKVRLLEPLNVIEVPVTSKALVLGAGVAGSSAALSLAEMGYPVYLVDRAEIIGGHMAQLGRTFPIFECSNCPQQIHCPRFSCVATRVGAVAIHPNVTLLSYSEVKEIEGVIGSYKVKVLKKPALKDF